MHKLNKYIYTCISMIFAFVANAQNRFPQPDFESGYEYPDTYYHIPNEQLWTTIDIVLLILLMSLVAWAVIKKRTRGPIILTSIISVAYFGFFRSGCVCSVGTIQNISLALVDETYVLPTYVFLLFILPIIFTFLFGRVFCAGVCPLGALQELVNIKNCKIPKAITTVLKIVPWIYLILAVLYAVTRSGFIICRLDPFIAIFRLGGDIGMIIFGAVLIVAAIFTGKPFCRFLCPYGALLSIFSRVSIWNIELTKKTCINCELCHNACPVDAIRAPYENKVKEDRMQGVKRIINYSVILPLVIFTGAILMRTGSDDLSRANKDVRLYDMVMQNEAEPQEELLIELEAFYGLGGSIENLTQQYIDIQKDFKLYSTIAGALIGLVIGIAFINLSVKRTRKLYDIDNSDCVNCGRCFSYCPQNKI